MRGERGVWGGGGRAGGARGWKWGVYVYLSRVLVVAEVVVLAPPGGGVGLDEPDAEEHEVLHPRGALEVELVDQVVLLCVGVVGG